MKATQWMALVVVGQALAGGCLGARIEQRQLITLAEPAEEIVFHDVGVFDVDTAQIVAHQDVVVRGDRIARVAPTDPTLAPRPGRRVVRGVGRTLLPGFVDTHVHLLNAGAPPWEPRTDNPEHNLEAYLYAGVTTIYDLAGFVGELHGLRKQLVAGEIDGPRLRFSGPPATAHGGAPISTIRAAFAPPIGDLVALYITTVVYEVDGREEARAAVAEMKDTDVDFVKVMFDQVPTGSPQLTRDAFTAIVDAAHEAGLKVFVHVGTPADMVVAAEAGADVLAHMPYRGEITEEQAARVAATSAVVACTHAAWVRFRDIGLGRFSPTALTREISPADLLDSVSGKEGIDHPDETHQNMRASAAKWSDSWPVSIRRLHAAGVPFVIGTDSAIQGVFPGGSFHDELALLSAAGIPNAELLVAATWRGARALDDAPSFGAVREGLAADLVLVEGDPIVDITRTADIAMVVRAGRVVNRTKP